jgi:glycosyltransferase involved in cell wall biosynthesis
LKKILYIWKDKYPWDVRVEKFCKSLVGAGYEVLLLCRWKGEEQEYEKVNGITIKRAGYQKSQYLYLPVSDNPLWKKAIINTVNDFYPDIIIVREILLGEVTGLIGRIKNIPVLMDMAEHYPAAMKDWKKYNSFFWRFLIRFLKIPDRYESRSVKLMDGIITVCGEQVQRLIESYNYPEQKTVVIYNTPLYQKPEYGFDLKFSDGIVFGHHGHMSSEKGIFQFVKGFSQALKIRNDIKLFLAGEGENYQEISDYIVNNGLQDNIELYGRYDISNLSNIMSKFNVGIIPYQQNLFNDYTLHNKLFDYFKFSKPVLSSNIKPSRRVIEQQGAGLAFNMTSSESICNAILQFIDADIEKLSLNSGISHEIYNWEIDSSNLIDFIKSY